MSKTRSLCLLLLIGLFAGSSALSAQAVVTKTSGDHRFGVGVNYWVSLSDIDFDDVDDNGFSYLVSYQYWKNLVGVELNVEFLPDRFGESAWAPEAYLLFGEGIYAAAGIGWINEGGSFESSPFFALRLGFDFKLFGNFYLDLAANYRFNDTAELTDLGTRFDTDTIFLGATLRYKF